MLVCYKQLGIWCNFLSGVCMQEAQHIQLTDKKRQRFMELVRQQKMVCQLLVSVSISRCIWFVAVSAMLCHAHL